MPWSDWKAFQSSHLNAGRYDADTRTLQVQFVNGAVYNYSSVPETVADSLFQTGSSQDFFNTKVKGVYGYMKVSGGYTKSGRRSTRRFV
jgi:hypothetical protein